MIGEHFLKSWSRTQNSVTLSSAEAELVAMVKVTAELIGVLYMLKDWGDDMKGRVYADSSAALAISNRRGSGKLRHIAIGLLWIQEKELRVEVEYKKIDGKLNPADLMTKYLLREKLEEHSRRLGQKHEEGRAQSGLTLQRGFEEDGCAAPPVASACEKGQRRHIDARGDDSGTESNARRVNSVRTGK